MSLLLAEDNVSESGCDGSIEEDLAGMFTETGDSCSQRTSQYRACVRAVRVVWAVRAVRAVVEW